MVGGEVVGGEVVGGEVVGAGDCWVSQTYRLKTTGDNRPNS